MQAAAFPATIHQCISSKSKPLHLQPLRVADFSATPKSWANLRSCPFLTLVRLWSLLVLEERPCNTLLSSSIFLFMKEMSLNVFPRSNDLLAKGGNSLKQIPGGRNTLGIFWNFGTWYCCYLIYTVSG
jgi:hypothetical protein